MKLFRFNGIVVLGLLTPFLHAQNPSYEPDPSWRAPSEAASRPNPLASRPETAAGGRKLFIRNCVECHGKNGSGMEKKHSADLQLPIVQQQSDGQLFWKITNGNLHHGMPSFSKLPELQRWQIVLYMRTLTSPIGIGGTVTRPPLPHHRTCGSAYGGSVRLS